MRFRVSVVCPLIFAITLACAGQGRVRLAPPPPTFTVGGFRSDFGSIQDAVSAAPEEGAIIRIRPGVYREIVHVDRPNIQLRGDGEDPAKIVLVFAASASTLSVNAADFYAEGITFANDSGRTEAPALAINGDRAVLRDVRILGGLVAGSKACPADCPVVRAYFEGCYLEGGFLSGDARVLFNECEIRSVWGTAGFVFEHSRSFSAGRVSSGGVLLHPGEAGKALTTDGARDYQADVFLRGKDGWNPQKVR